MTKPGRNAPCPCGSGKKFKQCCQHSMATPAASAKRAEEFLLYCHQGNVLYKQGDLAGARRSLEHALTLKPDEAATHYDLAVVLTHLNELPPAIAHYREAIRLQPENAESYCNLGALLDTQGQIDEAIACYRQSLALDASGAETHFCLAAALVKKGEVDAAIQSYLCAIAFKQDFSAAYNNLGKLLKEQGKPDAERVVYEQAIAANPNDAEAHANQADMLRDSGNIEQAALAYQRALAIQPDMIRANNNLALVLRLMADTEGAKTCYQRVVAHPDVDALVFSGYLFFLQYLPQLSPEQVFAEHRRFSERFETPLKSSRQPHTNSRDPGRRLRIGYVSADFRNHAVATFIEPILANHDKAQFEVFCYYNHKDVDSVTEHLMQFADHWISCAPMSDDDLAGRIRADGIDILVDLCGHTSHHRLLVFARKPAPIQMTWIGYAGTTGLDAMDYRITDVYMDPPGITEHLHSEQLIRLPNPAPYRPEPGCPEVNPLPALAGLPFTFGSLNAVVKINQEVANLWGRILNAVPGSRLMLGNITTGTLQKTLIERFGRAGVDESRLIFQPRRNMPEYLALHHQIDLGLDPFPYNGGTTTIHSLWMGVPVVSLEGKNMVSRCGSTMLSQAGLAEFVVPDQDAYFRLAVDLAHDLPRLNAIRQGLRSHIRAGQADHQRITRDLEAEFRTIWEKWCSGT